MSGIRSPVVSRTLPKFVSQCFMKDAWHIQPLLLVHGWWSNHHFLLAYRTAQTRFMVEDPCHHHLPYVDPFIGRVLLLEGPHNDQKLRLSVSMNSSQENVIVGFESNSAAGIIEDNAVDISIHDLQRLAIECDRICFGGHDPHDFDSGRTGPWNHPFIRLVTQFEGEDGWVLLATLLALNSLESTIRTFTGHAAARAPLLKDMIQDMSCEVPSITVSVLQMLLLPTGLNLRNLLWHGFVSDHIPRPWLALVVCLIQTLCPDSSFAEFEEHNGALSDQNAVKEMTERFRQQNVLQDVEVEGLSLLQSDDFVEPIAEWLPISHRNLWYFIVRTFLRRSHKQQQWNMWKSTPCIGMVLLIVVLEHGLRIHWCTSNAQPDDMHAHPGKFYVTLDGHGQRHKHNLLLHPYYHENRPHQTNHSYEESLERKENQLYRVFGPSTMALLTDLFTSPAGGPNLRAALSHGLLDKALNQEVNWLLTENGSRESMYSSRCSTARRMLPVVLAALHWLAQYHSSFIYRPRYSYTAQTLYALNQLEKFIQLSTVWWDKLRVSDDDRLSSSLFRRSDYTVIRILLKIVRAALVPADSSTVSWTLQDSHEEFHCNQRLAKIGASRLLLHEVVEALAHITSLESIPNPSILPLYVFSCAVTLSSIATAIAERSVVDRYGGISEMMLMLSSSNHSQTSDQLAEAIRRTRMVVSTVDTFLRRKNSTRCDNAIGSYARSKVIRRMRDALSHAAENSTA